MVLHDDGDEEDPAWLGYSWAGMLQQGLMPAKQKKKVVSSGCKKRREAMKWKWIENSCIKLWVPELTSGQDTL